MGHVYLGYDYMQNLSQICPPYFMYVAFQENVNYLLGR